MQTRLLTRAATGAALTLALAALAPPAASAAPSLLFVQDAEGGRLTHVGGERYRLQLDGVTAVDVFTDRPARSADRETPGRFLARWKARGFAQDAPNAALDVAGAAKGRDVAMVALRNPRYDARRRRLTYDAVALRGRDGAAGALSRFHARRDPLRAMRFGRASLFVDDGASVSYEPITLSFQGMPQQNAVEFQLGTGFGVRSAGGVQFSMGPNPNVGGVQMRTWMGAPVPFQELDVRPGAVELSVGSFDGVASFTIQSYLAIPSDAPASIPVQIGAPPQVAITVDVDGVQQGPFTAGQGTLQLR